MKAVSVRRWCGVESTSEVGPQVQRRAKTTSLCDFVDRKVGRLQQSAGTVHTLGEYPLQRSGPGGVAETACERAR